MFKLLSQLNIYLNEILHKPQKLYFSFTKIYVEAFLHLSLQSL